MICDMQMSSRYEPFGAVVALKPPAQAKSRLTGLVAPMRERLARMMALDTLRALYEAGAHLVVVGQDHETARMLSQEGIPVEHRPEPVPSGLNASLQDGATALQAAGYRRILACVGDLPALTADAVHAVLDAARLCDDVADRFFVPDRSGIGSTVLMVTNADLHPLFEGKSAAAHHGSGARPILLDGYPGVRSDVDTGDDLDAVIEIGVGRYTATLLDQSTGRIANYSAVTVATSPDSHHTAPDDHYSVITQAGVRLELRADQLDPQIRILRPGQRLHAAHAGSRLISAWW